MNVMGMAYPQRKKTHVDFSKTGGVMIDCDEDGDQKMQRRGRGETAGRKILLIALKYLIHDATVTFPCR